MNQIVLRFNTVQVLEFMLKKSEHLSSHTFDWNWGLHKIFFFSFVHILQAAQHKLQANVSRVHNGCFWKNLAIKYLRKVSILGPNNHKIRKTEGSKETNYKIYITKVSLLFQIFNLLVPKIEICLKYFSDKNSQKQPMCVARIRR